ncbi:MAG: hypothetical protein V2B14_03810 [bacterium]
MSYIDWQPKSDNIKTNTVHNQSTSDIYYKESGANPDTKTKTSNIWDEGG